MGDKFETLMSLALVTGCAGFIGSHLVDELLKKKWKVIGIDNFHPYYSKHLKELNLKHAKQDDSFEFHQGSILNNDDINKIPKNIDYVFHFAALPGVRSSFLNPTEYFKINVDGTKQILENFGLHSKIIFASSSSVYGDVKPDEFPVNEEHALNPIAPYSESKKKAEQLNNELEKRIKVTEHAVDTLQAPERILEWLEFDPTAPAGKRYGNSENHKKLKAWLKDPNKGNLKGVPVTFFLRGAKYAEARSKAVSELISTQ